MSTQYLTEQSSNTSIYEGSFSQFKIIYSNRHATVIEITNGLSDRVFKVPQNRVPDTLMKLELGIDPDKIARSFPIQ